MAYSNEYYIKNKARILANSARWQKKNRDKKRVYDRKWNELNKVRLAEKRRCGRPHVERKKGLPKTREQILLARKEYRERNREKIAEIARKYQKSHRKQLNAQRKKKLSTDLNERLKVKLRNRLSEAIRGKYKSGSAVINLGCSIDEFRFYMEGKFQDGMTWENWSYLGWHIDHILPLAYFDLSNPTQLAIACHYTNLQPLWAMDNFRKGKKIEKPPEGGPLYSIGIE